MFHLQHVQTESELLETVFWLQSKAYLFDCTNLRLFVQKVFSELDTSERCTKISFAICCEVDVVVL